jgi:hypothetical protein
MESKPNAYTYIYTHNMNIKVALFGGGERKGGERKRMIGGEKYQSALFLCIKMA